MKTVFDAGPANGFELQLLPEWDAEGPPLTDAQFADWTKTPKYTIDDVAKMVSRTELPILSVHSSRDVGNYLCSTQADDLRKGKRLIYGSLSLSETLGAELCVFHLWDTRKPSFDVDGLKAILFEISSQVPSVKASVEKYSNRFAGTESFRFSQAFRIRNSRYQVGRTIQRTRPV